MPFPFAKTITVIRESVDAYGDHTAGTSHQVEGCVVYPTTSTETIAGGMDVLTFGLTVVLPPGSDILSTDTVNVDGTIYRVADEPFPYQSPLTNTQSGIEAHLTAAMG